MPGALDLLAEMGASGWLQALASSAPQANINLLVEKLGIRKWLKAIHSGEDLPTGKPDPTLLLQTAGALQVPPERCIVVEDAPAGVEAARSAGMRCIAVATTRSRAVLTVADLLFDDLTQVTADAFLELIGQE
ncbi:MAG: HAD-IA family hydrolase, partial [Ardenticatenales bacterium]|nr:HAD-IA family hydrolase [Ardenticatenales bacterium]